ncbi:MAG: hypothetical protein Q9157_006170 [Trypethelium eluteriae]
MRLLFVTAMNHLHAVLLSLSLVLPEVALSIASSNGGPSFSRLGQGLNGTVSAAQNATSLRQISPSISPSASSSIRSSTQIVSSGTAASSGAGGLGSYIASGLGISKSSDVSSSTENGQTDLVAASTPINSGNSSVSSPSYSKNKTSTLARASPSSLSHTTILPANISANASFDSGNCWSDWMSFWSLNGSENAVQTVTNSATSTRITSYTEVITDPFEPAYTSTEVETWTLSETASANGFTYLTATSTSTWTRIESFPGQQHKTYTESYTDTVREGSSVYITTPHISIMTPQCKLPDVVPQCQSLWDNYASVQTSSVIPNTADCTGTSLDSSCSQAVSSAYSEYSMLNSLQRNAPSCSQASVGSAACSIFYDQYISSWRGANAGDDPAGGNPNPYLSLGYQSTESVAPNGSISVSAYWPSASILAPGCSIGCGPCAITGGTVRLLYWPVPETGVLNSTTARANSPESPVTAFAFGTSFISPTVYISYQNIFASDSCGELGTTHSTTIVPLSDPAQLSSIYQTWGMITDGTAPFNYTDLNTPVPQSIYNRQPQCASWTGSYLALNQANPSGAWTSNLTCPRTGAYAPILGKSNAALGLSNRSLFEKLDVPSTILQGIDPLWSNCVADIRGQYDPPYALQQAPFAAAPTPSDPVPSATPATPASAPYSQQPSQTGDPRAPIPSQPQGSPSSPNDPASNDPTPNDPAPNDPAPNDPAPNDPAPNDPAPNDPAPNDPAPNDPPSNSPNPGPATPNAPSPNDPAGSNPSPTAPDPAVAGGNGNGPPTNNPGAIMPSILAGGGGGGDPSASPTSNNPPPAAPNVGGSDPSDPQSNPSAPPGNNIAGAIPSIVAGHGAPPGGDSGSDPQVPAQPAANSGAGAGAGGGLGDGSPGASAGATNVPGVSPSPEQSAPPADSNGGNPVGGGQPGSADPAIPEGSGAGGGASPAAGQNLLPVVSGGGDPSVGGQPVSADPAVPGGIIVGGSSVSPGGAATVGGTAISNGPHGVVVGSTLTMPLPSPGQSATSIGGQAVAADPNAPGGIIVGGASIGKGQATTVAGTVISNGSQGIIVGSSSTMPVPSPGAGAAPSAAVFTMLGQTYTAQPGKPFVVDGATMSPGGPAATVSEQVISAGPSGVVVDGSSIAYSAAPGYAPSASTSEYTVQFSNPPNAAGPDSPAQQAAFTGTSGKGFTAVEPANGASTAVLSNSITLSVGGPGTVIDGRTVSLAPSGIVVDGQTDAFTSGTYYPSSSGQVAVYTDGQGHQHTAIEAMGESSTAVIDGSVTLTAGGPDTVLNGMTVTLAPSGLVVDGPVPTSGAGEQKVVFTDASGHTHTAVEAGGASNTAVIDGSVTLIVGGSSTVMNGETLSLASTGLVVDGSAEAFTPATTPSATGKDVIFTDVSGHVHTASEADGESGTAVVDGSITLTVGGSSTVLDGETLSLAPTGLVVNGTTDAFTTANLPGSTPGVGTLQPADASGAGRTKVRCLRDLIPVLSFTIMLIFYV